MSEHADTQRKKYAALKLAVQPQIYYVAENDACYVTVEPITYTFKSILKAVDIGFKLHVVLNLKFSPECHGVYTFLQRFVFKIATEQDMVSPSVAILISELNS